MEFTDLAARNIKRSSQNVDKRLKTDETEKVENTCDNNFTWTSRLNGKKFVCGQKQ